MRSTPEMMTVKVIGRSGNGDDIQQQMEDDEGRDGDGIRATGGWT